MDLKKLLNESESFKQAIADQQKADDINRHLGITRPEDLETILKTAGPGIFENPAITSEREARQTIEKALGLSGLGPDSYQTATETILKEIERTAGLGGLASSDPQSLADRFRSDIEKAAGGIGIDHASFLKDPPTINFEEIERRERERQLQAMSDAARDNMQHMARQAAEHLRREEAKVEYARRSAEASEEALAEERSKREAAEIAAKEAKADRDRAEERAERAERREERAVRISLVSLIAAVVGLLFAAWPFIRENLGQ